MPHLYSGPKMLRVSFLFLASASLLALASAGILQVSNGVLVANGVKVYLSGANMAWYNYGSDFGNNQYDVSGPVLEGYLQQVAEAGGNCVRMWLHVEGHSTPEYAPDGFVVSPDRTGTLVSDMRRFLDAAEARNIMVIFVLWNGAVKPRNEHTLNLYWDDNKLQSYIDNALKPMVSGLAGHRALAAWEIMGEPEGSMIPAWHEDPCADSTIMEGSGANWAGANVPMYRFQLFINWQADAIRSTDPYTLITVGTFSELSASNTIGRKNFYTDECLLRLGGRPGGYLDFYQIHSYTHDGVFNPSTPFKHTAWDFGLDKPVIIGEFASVCSEGMSIEAMYDHLYYNGYQGGLVWQYATSGPCEDSHAVIWSGMNHIRWYNDPNFGGQVAIDV